MKNSKRIIALFVVMVTLLLSSGCDTNVNDNVTINDKNYLDYTDARLVGAYNGYQCVYVDKVYDAVEDTYTITLKFKVLSDNLSVEEYN